MGTPTNLPIFLPNDLLTESTFFVMSQIFHFLLILLLCQKSLLIIHLVCVYEALVSFQATYSKHFFLVISHFFLIFIFNSFSCFESFFSPSLVLSSHKCWNSSRNVSFQ